MRSLLRVSPLAPVALVTAGVITLTTAAGTLTVRLESSGHPGRSVVAAAAPRPHPHASSLALPAAPAPAQPAPSYTGPQNQSAPLPAAALRVPRPRHLVEATLLVTSAKPLARARVRAIRRLDGVHAALPVAAGHARVAHHRAFLLGVTPRNFRAWTPKLTAASQPLWQSIARGELTASFDMGQGAKLPLGNDVNVKAKRLASVRVGAFASVGMAGVDGVVSAERAHQLGLAPRTGLVISAPKADPVAIRDAVRAVAGAHARTTLLREVIVIRDAGEFITRLQINTVLQSAASRVGVPYVWGATGPDSFDCSGLVQWSFARAGISMPRVSEQQWLTGPHIPYADARPGDLLFWHYDPTDPGNIDHVAIYAGNGMMLVAPHTGLNVEYVPVALNSAFAGVVRVDPGIASQV